MAEITATPLGNLFESLTAAFTFLDKLGEGLNQLILSDIPAHKQHEMTMRIRHCKRHCRVQHYNKDQVYSIVKIDFPDIPDLQNDIAKLLIFELKIEK